MGGRTPSASSVTNGPPMTCAASSILSSSARPNDTQGDVSRSATAGSSASTRFRRRAQLLGGAARRGASAAPVMTSAAGQSDLTSRQRRCFAEDGYLLLPSVLDAGTVDALAGRLDGLARAI